MKAMVRVESESERVAGWALLLAWIAIYGGSWAIAYTIYFLSSRMFGS